MATTKAAGEEPSIEEILASIREIISDDPFDGQKQAPSAAAAPQKPVEDVEEVLELDTPVTSAPAAPAPAASDPMPDFSVSNSDSLDFTDEIAALLEEPVKPEPVAMPDPIPAPKAAAPAVDTSLLDSSARDAVSAQLARLHANVALTRPGHDGMTIEDLMRDMLTPLLKEWLDANLPQLIEKLVEREIRQLVNRS